MTEVVGLLFWKGLLMADIGSLPDLWLILYTGVGFPQINADWRADSQIFARYQTLICVSAP